MKKLLGALMLVAFFAVSSAAYAQEAPKKDETKKEEKKETKKKKGKKEGKKEEKKDEKKPS